MGITWKFGSEFLKFRDLEVTWEFGAQPFEVVPVIQDWKMVQCAKCPRKILYETLGREAPAKNGFLGIKYEVVEPPEAAENVGPF